MSDVKLDERMMKRLGDLDREIRERSEEALGILGELPPGDGVNITDPLLRLTVGCIRNTIERAAQVAEADRSSTGFDIAGKIRRLVER